MKTEQTEPPEIKANDFASRANFHRDLLLGELKIPFWLAFGDKSRTLIDQGYIASLLRVNLTADGWDSHPVCENCGEGEDKDELEVWDSTVLCGYCLKDSHYTTKIEG